MAAVAIKPSHTSRAIVVEPNSKVSADSSYIIDYTAKDISKSKRQPFKPLAASYDSNKAKAKISDASSYKVYYDIKKTRPATPIKPGPSQGALCMQLGELSNPKDLNSSYKVSFIDTKGRPAKPILPSKGTGWGWKPSKSDLGAYLTLNKDSFRAHSGKSKRQPIITVPSYGKIDLDPSRYGRIDGTTTAMKSFVAHPGIHKREYTRLAEKKPAHVSFFNAHYWLGRDFFLAKNFFLQFFFSKNILNFFLLP